MREEKRLNKKGRCGNQDADGGPSSMADIPVPQGWEHVPAVGTGIGMQEIIKTTAVMRPTSGLKEISVLDIFFNRYNP